MRQFWKFSKPHGVGYGISKGFYLSVLGGTPVLPPISAIVSPKAANGALEGFGAPLVDSKDKALLDSPMIRGTYALATKDRKTVVRLMVMSAEEAGFSPDTIAKSALASRLSPDLLARLRSTWHLMQLSFESFDPDVYPSLDFILGIATRLGTLTNAVIADPISERYLMPNELFMRPRTDPSVDAREHIYVHSRPEGMNWHVFTKGLSKFLQPELELYGVAPGDQEEAARFLMAASQGVLQGFLIQNGSEIGPFEARAGGTNKALWGNTAVLELLPPTGKPVGELLRMPH
ncbi:MAG: hypothetical protein JST12_04160 [Armatimonadetes bacterium]|nr:hypothetical protein [Armatimonadota bacterium]MBS1726471.1 hypothetical protein [Armatimonadota bacterium]